MSASVHALVVLLLVPAPLVWAESIAGVCPDGSAFIVQDPAVIPCKRAKLVDPSELPPMRPQYLPRPYGWLVDQERRDPQNPYNLLDSARAIREAAEPEQPGEASREPVEQTEPAARPPARLALSDAELRDLAELIALRQQIAPAEFDVRDALGAEQLRIQLAHSPALTAQVLASSGRDPAAWHVVAFAAHALASTEFHPNFFVVQDGRTFRPDPADPAESALLLGAAGPLPKDTVALGYFALPARFDPRLPLEIWWNDRSVEAALAPEERASQ